MSQSRPGGFRSAHPRRGRRKEPPGKRAAQPLAPLPSPFTGSRNPRLAPVAPLDEKSVFLNIPFDERYRSLFVALVAGLTALGRSPRSVLEISTGRSRLDRICDLIESCGASVHDLSRVTLSGPLRVPRFNMPFELGIAYTVARRSAHSFFVLEERSHRLQASLSDLNGHDPYIHGGTQTGILRCLLDCFASPSGSPSLGKLQALTLRLSRFVTELQHEQALSHPFNPHLFRQTVKAAARLARAEELIQERHEGESS
jgi:hypothetical protein